MTAAIATQIRSRLDAIAAERASLDDEERRLKKALEALEQTASAEASETPGLSAFGRQRLKKAAEEFLAGIEPAVDIEFVRHRLSTGSVLPSMPYPKPHCPPPMSWRDDWGIAEGPQVDMGPNHLTVRTIGTTLPYYEEDGYRYYQTETAD